MRGDAVKGSMPDTFLLSTRRAMISSINCMLHYFYCFATTNTTQGKHIHELWSDLGEEMSHVQGAVVVRRPDLAATPGILAPANNLDFDKTLSSYASTFEGSLFPYRYVALTWDTRL